VHSWAEDDYPNVAEWGIRGFSPGDLRHSSEPLLGWLAATGCTRVAIHFDVDTIDSDEIVLGLGVEPGGLTGAQVRRIVTDVRAPRTWSDSPSRSTSRGRSCTCSRS
jgi:arginase